MKRAISVILSVFLTLGASGCSRLSRDNSVDMAGSEAETVLSRTDAKTVYGVEAPDPLVAMQLDMPTTTQATAEQLAAKKSTQSELRAVWLTYINLDSMVKGKTKAQFTAAVDMAFGNIATFGFNTVFVQVRPFGDALYNSAYFPWSYTLTGIEGQNPGYDPLTIMCALADTHALRIEAWLNPYRVRAGGKQPLAANNQAKKWIAAGNDGALEWNGGVYYNPGSAAARKLIVNGVKEIVSGYAVDGIHFDDYFYPTTDMAFDAATHKASGSKLTQADWRRENVNLLVRDVYAAVKAIDPDCLFGISPQGNTKNNYEGQFADTAKWLSNKGYVDYICPQIYYGFDNGTNPYSATVDKWDSMIKVDGIDLYVGIAAYKLGVADQWAGAGKNEWVNTDGILADMVADARGASRYGGVAIYSYDSLFAQSNAQVKAEKASLKKLFQ